MRRKIIPISLAIVAATASACGRVEAEGQANPSVASAPAQGQTLRDAATLNVFIDLPEDAVLTSPMRIVGTADSRFFNEGVFPVRLLGANGCILGEAPGLPQGDWTAPGQVRFEAILAFDAAPGSSAILVFEEDIAGEDPLAPLEVRTRVRIAGVLDPERADPDPQDCVAEMVPGV